MKNLFLKYWPELIIFIMYFLMPIIFTIFAMLAMVTFDTITGIIKAKKINQKITSRALGRIIPKTIIYLVFIFAARVLELYMIPQIPWVSIFAGLIGTIEIKSILENASSILGYDALKGLIKFIGRKQEDSYKESDEKEDKPKPK